MAMSLASGLRLGPYAVLSPLGEGGMGEVYLARDTRLDRTVAIKCVKDALVLDPDRRARVEREAKIVAQLSHPHVCTLFDVVQDNGQTYLVMEALAGESLATRLLRFGDKGLPIAQCLTIAAEAAEGLAFAHQHGVVHQDVKPANIMLTPGGAKLLDFGVARLRRASGETGLTVTATSDDDLARAGTLPYMAPEQLDGRTDARSDIFALGAVLYEMLTGARAFIGSTASTVIAQIVEHEPPPIVTSVAPAALVRVVRRCLAKDPHARWQSAADLADELRWISSNLDVVPSLEPHPRMSPRRRYARIGVGLAVAALVCIVGWIARRWTASGSLVSRVAPLHSELALPADLRLVSDSTGSPPAISHDGRFLAFVAVHEAVNRLYVRDLQTAELRVLAGTEGARAPFWSPNGQSLAFFADGQLKRVSPSGGAAHKIASVGAFPGGGDWNRQDVILFAPEYINGGLWRVPAAGGTPEVVLLPNRSTNEQSLSWPRFLPDGQSFLYVRDSGRREQDSLMVSMLERPAPVELRGIASSAVFAEPGILLYVRNGWLVAQPFDTTRRTLHGEPTLLAGPVEVYESLGAAFDARSIDRVIYRPFPPAPALQLAWHARNGTILEEIGRPEIGLASVSLSRDGTKLVGTQLVGETLAEQTDLWIFDLARGSKTRLTTTDSWESGVTLSPDAREVAFGSDESGTMNLYSSSIARAGDRRLLASASGSPLWPTDWSSDGRAIVGTGLGAQTQQDVWMYSFDTRALTWLLRTPAREGIPKISPNGRWLAYQSDESGQFEVYIVTLPLSADRWKISTTGGSQPQWRADGRELFFIGPGSNIYAVALDEDEHRLTRRPPSRLFNVPGWKASETLWTRYGVSPDGQRFLIARDVNPATVEAYSMILGWRPPVTQP